MRGKVICKPCNIAIENGNRQVKMIKAEGSNIKAMMIDCEIEIANEFGFSTFEYATDLKLSDYKQVEKFVKAAFKEAL